MKFATVAAICAAPLALASSLEMDLRARGLLTERNNLVVGGGKFDKDANNKDNSNNGNGNSNGNNGNSNGNNNGQITSITQSSTTEVIFIWFNPGGNAATTTVNSAAASTAAAAATATHTVVVGGSAGKIYTPDTIAASIGDVVLFQFQEQNHTVTQSQFAVPCVANGTFDTGFMPNINSTTQPPPTAAMTIMVDTPLWFYCQQTGHCGEGMTFSINPTANKTQADFKANAIAQNGTGTTASIIAGSGSSTTVSVASSSSTGSASPPGAPGSSGSAGSGSSITAGTGTLASGGECTCSVQCATGSFPNPAAQGMLAFGGMSGSLPAADAINT